jgi:hypothetical protein
MRVEYRRATEEEYNDWKDSMMAGLKKGEVTERVLNLRQYRELVMKERVPKVRVRTYSRTGNKGKGKINEGKEKVGIAYYTNGHEITEKEVEIEGAGMEENDYFKVVEVGAEGWFQVEWDVGRWRESSRR